MFEMLFWVIVGLYLIFGAYSLGFYVKDFEDVEWSSDKIIVCLIALFLPPIFWFLRVLIGTNFKL